MILYRPSTREYITCPECGLPHGVIEDGHLVILSRHHGRTHRLQLNPVDLREMAERIEKTTNIDQSGYDYTRSFVHERTPPEGLMPSKRKKSEG